MVLKEFCFCENKIFKSIPFQDFRNPKFKRLEKRFKKGRLCWAAFFNREAPCPLCAPVLGESVKRPTGVSGLHGNVGRGLISQMARSFGISKGKVSYVCFQSWIKKTEKNSKSIYKLTERWSWLQKRRWAVICCSTLLFHSLNGIFILFCNEFFKKFDNKKTITNG